MADDHQRRGGEDPGRRGAAAADHEARPEVHRAVLVEELDRPGRGAPAGIGHDGDERHRLAVSRGVVVGRDGGGGGVADRLDHRAAAREERLPQGRRELRRDCVLAERQVRRSPGRGEPCSKLATVSSRTFLVGLSLLAYSNP